MRKNKKYAALLLVVILALSMCIPALARYDQCKKCEDGTFETTTTRTVLDETSPCANDPSKRDPIHLYERYATCNNCGYTFFVGSYTKVVCSHPKVED